MTRDEVCAEDWRPQSYFVHAGQGSGLPHCLGTSSDQLERLGQVAGPGAPARECAGQTVSPPLHAASTVPKPCRSDLPADLDQYTPMLPATLAARAEAEDYAPPPLLLLLGSGGASRAPSPPSSTSAASRLSSATPPPEAGRGAPVPAPLSIHDWLVQAADCEGYCPNNHYAETRRRSMEGAPGCMRGQVARGDTINNWVAALY